jgi:transposase InsO family protein
MKVGMSRQNYYKSRKSRCRQEVDEQLVRDLVNAERAVQPRLGGLKLHCILGPEMEAAGLVIGRDRFFEVLRNQGLLLKPLPRAPRTTNSNHSLPVFRNLVKDKELTGINQVWVSDITYIRTILGFVYLSLIMDMYSRKIVGYHLAQTLEAQETLKALDKALLELPDGVYPIHHSDRGSQYCSHDYVKQLKKHGLSISMTEENHCAENSMAERLNGILKQEYYLKHEFRTLVQASKGVDEAVYLYNTRRPHRSLQLRTPDQVHCAAAINFSPLRRGEGRRG